jgi:hypothetical protein
MHLRHGLITVLALGFCTQANAGIIGFTTDVGDFLAAGGTSLTGPLPELGNQGSTVTLGDATLTAGNDIFVGSGWSSLLPDGMAIAISGLENLQVSINTGLSTGFGGWLHEPSRPDRVDGCNTACEDSTFLVQFWLGASLVDDVRFNAPDDRALFGGVFLDEVFDRVTIDEIVGSHDNEFFGEMYVVRVPEPATLWLLGGSLIGIGLLRRRRSA